MEADPMFRVEKTTRAQLGRCIELLSGFRASSLGLFTQETCRRSETTRRACRTFRTGHGSMGSETTHLFSRGSSVCHEVAYLWSTPRIRGTELEGRRLFLGRMGCFGSWPKTPPAGDDVSVQENPSVQYKGECFELLSSCSSCNGRRHVRVSVKVVLPYLQQYAVQFLAM